MENKQYEVCLEILRRLDRAGILDKVKQTAAIAKAYGLVSRKWQKTVYDLLRKQGENALCRLLDASRQA